MQKGTVCWLLSITLLLLQGCAIVKSKPGSSGGSGVAYMLPRALLPVELVYDGNAYEVRIKDPVIVGDRKHTYLLQRSSNVFSSDNVTISVDSATGLLTAIDVKSEDQTIPAIVQLASGFAAESANARSQTVVFRGLFDPGWNDAQVTEFNSRLGGAASAHNSRLRKDNNCSTGATDEPCKTILALADRALGQFEVHVHGGGAEKRKLADCSAGFCYRINVPHVVTLSGPGTSNSAVFGLPNQSPTYVMPLERWAFVKTTHDVKLDTGVFKSITTDRPSSALALASAPLDVAKATLTTAAELVSLKIDLSGKEKALADAKVAEIQAKAALDKALLEQDGSETAESAIARQRKQPGASLLSIRVGNIKSFDATANLRPSTTATESTRANPTEAVDRAVPAPVAVPRIRPGNN